MTTSYGQYRQKFLTPNEAVARIQPGDRVCMSFGNEPQTLLTALAGRAEELRGIEVVGPGNTELAVWLQPGFGGPFRAGIETMAGIPLGFAALGSRFADYYPQLFSKTYKAFDERPQEAHPVDVGLITVTPPNDQGMCSFGLNVWYQQALARRARLTIAEVAPDMVRTRGNGVHISEIDILVEKAVTRPPRYREEPETHTYNIAHYVAELIRDGDTLQFGMGTVSSRLVRLGVLEGKRDLGWHSEATSIGVLKWVQNGVINGARKTVDRGLLVTTSLSVAEDERTFVETSGQVEVRDATEVNDIRAIAAQDNMVAVNSAISVDLTGQIVAESIGPRMWRGTGGQPEFAIGAFLSKGGRSITVLPSVTSSGVSRICGQLEPGSYVTVPRYFADTIVTEWGVARLLGKSQRQRAEELISIAHPDHRTDLRKIARKLFWP